MAVDALCMKTKADASKPTGFQCHFGKTIATG